MDAGSALGFLPNFDARYFDIIRLSLIVSCSATGLAGLIGLPLGAALALLRFPGRWGLVVILNAFMGLPPVVVGSWPIFSCRARGRWDFSVCCSRRQR
jgi:tungstate transport system permease protein